MALRIVESSHLKYVQVTLADGLFPLVSIYITRRLCVLLNTKLDHQNLLYMYIEYLPSNTKPN